ncbi:uncharacterized protein RHOBADRAFT_49728 [Rhodotorula graminis WP1]|uniref:Proteophosphoglycan ppg4 n=1 Tax=Rhodotorula graminis (strain WP1) TaxID=578459 RepID=A0A194S1M9_RHOGW|nr:uncharacterized protein RHOBADRAFT_49728 [Rhodotorula graminis WP1]KPV74633.1 hypothetical protein RHOBADRAFT_49728 [Rhodotorula graminis WP1]
MRGRVSSSAALAPAPAPAVKRKRARDGDGERERERGGAASATSSILVPRAERAQVKDGRKKDKGKQNEKEKEKKRGKVPKGGKLRAEAEGEDELDEVEQRLRARRERRRAKALIRKDRTLTAAAVGTAAAEKVKASRRRRQAASDGETDEDQENEGVARKKVKRTTKEGRSRKVVQEMGKAKNVTSGRLTLKPKPQIGIFNKGKASTRMKLGGKGIPDFAFSERAFLHGSASSAASSSSSSSTSSSASSSSDSLSAPVAVVEPPRRRTYGSKPANRTSLSRRASSSWPAVAPEPASFDTPFLPSTSPAPAPAPDPASAPHSKARRSLTRRFSHVELPLRPSSPAASSAAQQLRGALESNSGVRSAESLARVQRLRKDEARAEELRQHEGRRASSAAALDLAHEEQAPGEVEASEGAATDDVERLLREVESAGAGVEPDGAERRSEFSYGGGAGDFGDALDARDGVPDVAGWAAPAGGDMVVDDNVSPLFALDDERRPTASLDLGPSAAFDPPHDSRLEPFPPFDNLGAPLPSSSASLSTDPPARPPSSLDAPQRFSSTRFDPRVAPLHDDSAYRAAMRAQWPRTTL